jgi:predicted dehydrogenase
MESLIRLGLIGAGNISLFTLPYLKEAAMFRLAAVADVSEASRQRAVKEWGYEHSYTDYHDMLSKEPLDAVLIATPHHLLHDCCLAAIAAGKNVFVEKPMALNHREAFEIVKAARTAKIKFMVGYCLRYTPARVDMKKLYDKGVIGDPVAIFANKSNGPLPGMVEGWLTDPNRGGGQLLYLGSHLIDQILWMVDSPVKQVYAEITRNPENGIDQTTVALLRMGNGARAQVLLSQQLGMGCDYVEIIGTKGRLRADWYPVTKLEIESQVVAAYNNPTTTIYSGDRVYPMYLDEFKEFGNAIRENRAPAITAEDGLRLLEVIDAIIESAQKEKPVEIKGLS